MTEHDLLAQPAADYMNEAQQHFFRELLLAQRDDLQARIDAEFQALRVQLASRLGVCAQAGPAAANNRAHHRYFIGLLGAGRVPALRPSS